MGWVHTGEEMARREAKAMADDVYLEWPLHIWPLMGYVADDARWKQSRTAEVELYALCGVRLRSYVEGNHGPVEYGDHWADGAHEICPECQDKWSALVLPGWEVQQHQGRSRSHIDLTNLFISLHTGDPGKSGDDHEVSGGGYARQPIAFEPDTATMSFVSKNEQQFLGMPKAKLTHFTIRNVVGQVLFSGKLTAPAYTLSGNTARFGAGHIRVTL